MTIILISGLHLKNYISSPVYNKNVESDEENSETMKKAKSMLNYASAKGDTIMNGINIYSIWFFITVTLLSFWYKRKIANSLDLSEYTSNTNKIIVKMTKTVSELEDLILLKKYLGDNNQKTFDALINNKDGLLNRLGYDYDIDEKKNKLSISSKIQSQMIYILFGI